MSLENREKTTRKLISHREYYRESFADMFSWSTNQFLNMYVHKFRNNICEVIKA